MTDPADELAAEPPDAEEPDELPLLPVDPEEALPEEFPEDDDGEGATEGAMVTPPAFTWTVLSTYR